MKWIKKILIGSLLCLGLFLILNAKNKTNETLAWGNTLEIKHCPYTEAYKEWLKLSDEEKINTIMPSVCDLSANKTGFLLIKNITNNQKYEIKNLSNIDDYPYYDLRNVDGTSYITPVKNQLNENTCWTFSALSSVESNILKTSNETYDLSERHLEYSTTRYFTNDQINNDTFYRSLDTGGNQFMAAAYFMNGDGPILESDMPYQDNSNLIDISEIKNKKRIIDVDEISFYPSDEISTCTNDQISTIKNFIINNGAVDTSFYINGNYYNDNNGAYFYNGTNYSNHAVSIIGWDDNYKAENFKFKPSRDGAWIIKNSYGTTFGDNGYIYISYDDINICNMITSINKVDFDIDDNIYAHDTLGFNSSVGTGATSIMYGAMKFTKEPGIEVLKSIVIGTIAKTNYTIYINKDNDSIEEKNLTKIKSGTIEHQGYTTIDLDEDILLSNTSFSIVVKYDTPNYYYPLPIQSKSNGLYLSSHVEVGKSFMGFSLSSMTDTNDYDEGTIVSIKAKTNNLLTSNDNIHFTNDAIIVNNASDIDTFLNTMNNNFKYYYEVYDELLSSKIDSGKIKTGMKIKANNNWYSTNIVLLGDVNSDGNFNMADIMKVANYVVDNSMITDKLQLTAGDANYDNNVKMNDIMALAKKLVDGGN